MANKATVVEINTMYTRITHFFLKSFRRFDYFCCEAQKRLIHESNAHISERNKITHENLFNFLKINFALQSAPMAKRLLFFSFFQAANLSAPRPNAPLCFRLAQQKPRVQLF